jgi:hypothetical protein
MVVTVIDRRKRRALRNSWTTAPEPDHLPPARLGAIDGQDRAGLCRGGVDGVLGAARERHRVGSVVIPDHR